MYVCVCQAVTDRQIHHAVRNGVASFSQLQMELGVARCCGRCRPVAQQVFSAALSAQFPSMPARVSLSDGVAA